MFFWRGVFFVRGLRGLQLCYCFFYVTGEVGRKYVRYMPWPQAAECNMITNKQTLVYTEVVHSCVLSFYTLCMINPRKPAVQLNPRNEASKRNSGSKGAGGFNSYLYKPCLNQLLLEILGLREAFHEELQRVGYN